MSVDWGQAYAELKGWQTGIGALLGFAAIIAGALYNARLNRERDARLRSDEMIAVASALYGEIVILRKAVARMANAVAHRYGEHGVRHIKGGPFDRHFIEQITLPPLRLYPALAAKVGMLPSQIALEIVRFYARLEEAQTWLPRLQEDAERRFTYSVLYVLDPAIEAVMGVVPALTAIEDLAGIDERIGTPDIKKAVSAQGFERTLHEE
jgi:hypothetical protein